MMVLERWCGLASSLPGEVGRCWDAEDISGRMGGETAAVSVQLQVSSLVGMQPTSWDHRCSGLCDDTTDHQTPKSSLKSQ